MAGPEGEGGYAGARLLTQTAGGVKSPPALTGHAARGDAFIPMRLRLWVVILAAVACACATARKREAEPEVSSAEQPAVAAPVEEAKPAADEGSGIRFAVTPEDSVITLNGKAMGRVSDLSISGGFLPLGPGIYQVSLKRDGFLTWRAEVTVSGHTEPLLVELVKKP